MKNIFTYKVRSLIANSCWIYQPISTKCPSPRIPCCPNKEHTVEFARSVFFEMDHCAGKLRRKSTACSTEATSITFMCLATDTASL